MAGEQEVQVTEQEVQEAKTMGWADREQWRGAPEEWVDAKTFLTRGRQILPMLQKNNERLLDQVNQLSTRVASAEASVRAADAVIKELEESHAEDVKAQVEAAREELKADLTEALKDGDHERAAELTGKIAELNTANRDAGGGEEDEEAAAGRRRKPAKVNEDDQVPPAIKAEVADWYSKNQEYNTDLRRRALMNAVAYELRQKGNTLLGKAFLDKCAEEVDATLGAVSRGGSSRVESGGGGSGRRDARPGAGKTYNDLPAEAKAACDRMASRLVGPNRKHKDLASWQTSYVKQYFAGEQS